MNGFLWTHLSLYLYYRREKNANDLSDSLFKHDDFLHALHDDGAIAVRATKQNADVSHELEVRVQHLYIPANYTRAHILR